MCGIAGFSLTAQSKVKTRQLANAMLTAIEDRGNQASGYAFWHDDRFGYHSEAKPGSGLSLKFLPRKAQTVILHTRLATHGSVKDNRNNHPVTSPTGNIALVHNGVIYNHYSVRNKITGKLPDVDTSVIPAVIEQHGLDSINLLDGDAAIAWLDKREPGILHLARYQHSPLCVAQIEDGSFVFASTENLLWRILIQLDLTPIWMHNPKELDYYQIKAGAITAVRQLPEPLYQDDYDFGYYRHQTSGAKGGYSSPYGYDYYDADYWENAYLEDLDDNDEMLPKAEDPTALELDIPNERYWVEMKDELALKPSIIYFADYEYDLWVNELYYLAHDPETDLIDYGEVDGGGVLVSSKATMDF